MISDPAFVQGIYKEAGAVLRGESEVDVAFIHITKILETYNID